ncbi:MAG: ribosome silencing factor [Muribaculaceae bacterium]
MSENNDISSIIIDAIQDLKGRRISIVDLSHIDTAATGRFIIAEGTSTMQVSSIADRVRERLLADLGVKPYNADGQANAEWIVIDYGHVWVHIFIREKRELYNLESLWSDASITDIPDLD